jgi:hypothetical protein
MSLLTLVLGCAVACAAQAPAEQTPSELPVSIDRIKERLNQPAVLQPPAESQADFRATVIEAYTLPETALEALRRDLAGDLTPRRIPPGTITPPLVSVDLLQITSYVKRRLGGALRARAERNARNDVAAALAEFCAEHDCSVPDQNLPRLSGGDEGKPSLPEGVLLH